MKAIVAVLIGLMGIAAVAQDNCQEVRWIYKTARLFDLRNEKAQDCAARYCGLAKRSLADGTYLFTYPEMKEFRLQSTRVQNCVVDTASIPGSLILRTIEKSISYLDEEQLNRECSHLHMGEGIATTCDIKYEQ